jgi:hypothetical protein
MNEMNETKRIIAMDCMKWLYVGALTATDDQERVIAENVAEYCGDALSATDRKTAKSWARHEVRSQKRASKVA